MRNRSDHDRWRTSPDEGFRGGRDRGFRENDFDRSERPRWDEQDWRRSGSEWAGQEQYPPSGGDPYRSQYPTGQYPNQRSSYRDSRDNFGGGGYSQGGGYRDAGPSGGGWGRPSQQEWDVGPGGWGQGMDFDRGRSMRGQDQGWDRGRSMRGSDQAWDRESDSHRGKGPKGYRRSDERIREDANDALTDDPMIDASSIEIEVKNGEVTLSGTVTDRRMRRRAEDVIEGLSGVRHVQNNLRVQSGQESGDNKSGQASTGSGNATSGSAGSQSSSRQTATQRS